jgi:hypothetical protein
MDHVLTEHGLRLTYLRDPNVMNDLDQDHIFDDLSDDTPDGDPLSVLTQYRLADYDHLVLVTDRCSGRYLAFLAANDRATGIEEFLLLESIFVATAARGQNLMRRMLALALLRIGGLGPVPSIIAACIRNPLCYRIIRDTARRFRDAELYRSRKRHDKLSHRYIGAADCTTNQPQFAIPCCDWKARSCRRYAWLGLSPTYAERHADP